MEEYLKTARQLFGKSLEIAMKERDIGINQLSELSGVNKPQIYKVIYGKPFHIDTYLKLARFLQIHIDFSLMDVDNNVFTNDFNKPSDN